LRALTFRFSSLTVRRKNYSIEADFSIIFEFTADSSLFRRFRLATCPRARIISLRLGSSGLGSVRRRPLLPRMGSWDCWLRRVG
jgi:hypothetical protein